MRRSGTYFDGLGLQIESKRLKEERRELLQVAPWPIDPILRRYADRVCEVSTEMFHKCCSPEFTGQLAEPVFVLRKHFLIFGLRNTLPVIAHFYNGRLVEGIMENYPPDREWAIREAELQEH